MYKCYLRSKNPLLFCLWQKRFERRLKPLGMGSVKRSIFLCTLFVLLTFCLSSQVHAQREALPNRSTDTNSTNFSSAEERINFLDTYLNFPSSIKDAHYHIVYFDNESSFPPGPSDWDMRIVIWLEPKDVPLWLEGMKEISELEDPFTWVTELDTGLELEILTNASYFEASGKRAALLEEGTVALWYSTLY